MNNDNNDNSLILENKLYRDKANHYRDEADHYRDEADHLGQALATVKRELDKRGRELAEKARTVQKLRQYNNNQYERITYLVSQVDAQRETIVPQHAATITRRQTMKLMKLRTAPKAWLWLFEQYAKHPEGSLVPNHSMDGICLALGWMRRQRMITYHLKERMAYQLYHYFRPREEKGSGGFFWRPCLRRPRMMACYILSQVSR